MPTAENIQWIFDHSRELLESKEIDWSIEEECCWSFILADPSEDKLVDAAELLLEAGYDVQGLFQAEEEDEDEDSGPDDMIYMQIDQIALHSPHSLMAECDKIQELVAKLELAEFNGIEVGPVEDLDEGEADEEE